MELTASKTAACTMPSAREAAPGLFCRGWASRLSFFNASRATAFHSSTTSADGRQRASSDSTWGFGVAFIRAGPCAGRASRPGARRGEGRARRDRLRADGEDCGQPATLPDGPYGGPDVTRGFSGSPGGRPSRALTLRGIPCRPGRRRLLDSDAAMLAPTLRVGAQVGDALRPGG